MSEHKLAAVHTAQNVSKDAAASPYPWPTMKVFLKARKPCFFQRNVFLTEFVIISQALCFLTEYVSICSCYVLHVSIGDNFFQKLRLWRRSSKISTLSLNENVLRLLSSRSPWATEVPQKRLWLRVTNERPVVSVSLLLGCDWQE